jgi:hypothetical protein
MEPALYPPAGGQVMDLFTLETVEIKLTDLPAGRLARKRGRNCRISMKSAGTTSSPASRQAGGRQMLWYVEVNPPAGGQVEYTLSKGADYVFRLKADAFNLYDKTGKVVDMQKKLRRTGESAYTRLPAGRNSLICTTKLGLS